MIKGLGVFVLSSFLLLVGCQKNGVNGNLGGNLSGNTPSGTGCPTAAPACPSGDGTCAYITWQESSIGDPAVATPILYNIYYGNTSGVYTSQISAINGLCYQLTGLTPGNYYFAATAYNSNGESSYSSEVATTINLSVDQLRSSFKETVVFEKAFVVTGQPRL